MYFRSWNYVFWKRYLKLSSVQWIFVSSTFNRWRWLLKITSNLFGIFSQLVCSWIEYVCLCVCCTKWRAFKIVCSNRIQRLAPRRLCCRDLGFNPQQFVIRFLSVCIYCIAKPSFQIIYIALSASMHVRAFFSNWCQLNVVSVVEIISL